MVKAVNPAVAKFYVMMWICIGAFVFRNIFAGIMGTWMVDFHSAKNIARSTFSARFLLN